MQAWKPVAQLLLTSVSSSTPQTVKDPYELLGAEAVLTVHSAHWKGGATRALSMAYSKPSSTGLLAGCWEPLEVKFKRKSPLLASLASGTKALK